MKFDLHTHTNNSDGILSYKELIDLAIKKNLSGISITDHDNIDGIQDAIDYSSKFNNFKIIPGIEFSSVYGEREVHILGYFIDHKDKRLINLSQEIKLSRINRGLRIIEKLKSLGIDINIEDIKSFSQKDFIGRPHIARALIKNSYVKNIAEAFDKYLGINAPAYVDRYKISIETIIDLIKKIGGISVLAHPGLIGDKNIIDYCISKGVNGLEVIYPKHSKEDFQYLFARAKKNNLIMTGGSDFHGDRSKEIILGDYYVGIDTINQMEMRI